MSATVVIRAKDEAASIGRTLDLVANQTVDAQVVLVDSGSSDDTVGIARRAGAEVVEIPAGPFTYGGALNTGAERAQADFVVALSAHAFPVHDRWLEAMWGYSNAAGAFHTAPDANLLERSRREWYVLGMYLDLEPYPARREIARRTAY